MRRALLAATAVLFLLGTGGAATYVHYDGKPLQWLGFCECRIHHGKADLVVRYWDRDALPGLTKGDRIYSEHWEPCIDGRAVP